MSTNFNGIIFDDEQPSSGNYSGIIFDDEPLSSKRTTEWTEEDRKDVEARRVRKLVEKITPKKDNIDISSPENSGETVDNFQEKQAKIPEYTRGSAAWGPMRTPEEEAALAEKIKRDAEIEKDVAAMKAADDEWREGVKTKQAEWKKKYPNAEREKFDLADALRSDFSPNVDYAKLAEKRKQEAEKPAWIQILEIAAEGNQAHTADEAMAQVTPPPEELSINERMALEWQAATGREGGTADAWYSKLMPFLGSDFGTEEKAQMELAYRFLTDDPELEAINGISPGEAAQSSYIFGDLGSEVFDDMYAKAALKAMGRARGDTVIGWEEARRKKGEPQAVYHNRLKHMVYEDFRGRLVKKNEAEERLKKAAPKDAIDTIVIDGSDALRYAGELAVSAAATAPLGGSGAAVTATKAGVKVLSKEGLKHLGKYLLAKVGEQAAKTAPATAIQAKNKYDELTMDEYSLGQGGELKIKEGDEEGIRTALAAVGSTATENILEGVVGILSRYESTKLMKKLANSKNPFAKVIGDIGLKFDALSESTGVGHILTEELPEENVQYFFSDVLGWGKKDSEYKGFFDELNAAFSDGGQYTLEGQWNTVLGMLLVMGGQAALAGGKSAIDHSAEGRKAAGTLESFGFSKEQTKQFNAKQRIVLEKLLNRFAAKPEELKDALELFGGYLGQHVDEIVKQTTFGSQNDIAKYGEQPHQFEMQTEVGIDGDSTGKATKEALIGGGVQSGIELLGGKVLGKAWGATGGKLIGKADGTTIGQKVAENSIVKGVGKITNWLKTPLEITGWSGMPGKIGEEFMQGAIDAYFGLDTTDAEEKGTTAGGRFKKFAGDFFKGENLADLAGSMLLMQAVGGGSAYLQKRYTNKQLNKIITEEIGGVSENVLNKLSPEEKARIIEAHYSGLSADEAAAIINKGAGALDKFMIEKQTEATKSAKGRAILAETNPEAADAIRAARREGKDISRKMIRDLGLSEKVLGDVESRNKFGDALLEDGRARAAKNLSKMDGQQKMALGETIAHFVDVNDEDIKKKVYDQIASEITDASVLDDPYQREQLVMKAVDAVYQKEGLGIKVPGISTKEVVNETRTDETPAKSEQAQSVTPPTGETARPLEAGKAPSKVGGEVTTPTKPKTVKEGKAFVNSNIGKRFTDGKKTYEITGLTKDGEVSVKVTDKIGKSSETTLKLSGTLTNIFGTKKKSAVWSEVKTPETEQKSPNRTKTTAETPKAEQKAPKTEVKKPTKPLKANPKKAAEVVKEFVAKDEVRSSIKHIHHDHDSGLAVATDGRILIATKHGYDPNYKDDSQNPYPNWRRVVPSLKKGEGQTITIDPNAVLEATKTVKKLASGIKSDNMIRIKLPNGKHTYMSVNTLSRVVKAMAANGITEITTEGPFKPLLAKNNDTTIVAMPMRNGDGDVKLGRNAETKIVTFDLESGKVISAPESKIDKMRRGFAEKLRTDIAEGRTKEIEWLRTTELYKGLIAAQKKGETDAKKVYEGITREEGSWDNLSEANKKLFAELLATKDIAELENRFSEYSAKMKDSKKQSPQNDWVERTPKELAKLEKEIAAEDAVDAMMADAEPKTAPKKEAKAEPKSESAPTITPFEAMKKLGSLGAADVDTLTKAMHREERLGHTERANMIRVLRDYKRGVGTNSNPQSDETSGGKYRASVEAAKPLDDPAFVAWAKKRGVAPTTQKRNEYDKAMADTLKNRLSRWIKGVSVEWVNFIAPEEGGDVRAAKKYSRAGTVDQVVPENERAVFRQEFMRLKSDYEHSNEGNAPLSGGLFTSDAYYLYDIIGDNPVSIERIPINDTNREKIAGLDKKYKAEIYKGTRNSAYWADRFRNELSGHLSSGNGVDNGEGSFDFGDMDSGRIRQERQSISGSRGDSSSSEDNVSPIRLLHDGERIVGSYNRATGEVKLAKGASVETVLHELGWHAAHHWAEVNADSDPKAKALLEQMKKSAESAPKEIKDAVRDVYGDLDADTLLDEIGAARFTKEQSGKIAKALATKEGAAWYQKVWNKVVDFFKNFLTKIGYNRVDLDGIENMSPEVFGDFLADVMMSGKQLGERTAFSMEAPKGLAAKWTNNLSDYKAPIAELEKRVMTSSNKIYYLARTLEGQAQRGKNRAERAIRRVEKILGKDISPELLAQYMQLKAYEERNAKIERRNGKADASGMTPEDARAIEKTIEDSGVDEAIFEEAAQIFWDLQKEGLQARVDAGLLDQETANKWMTDEPHHIPWKDAVDPDSGEYVGRRMGASEFDTAEGRKTAASGDPITWMLQEYQDAMTRAAQNRLRSSIANLTRLNGDVGTIYDGIQTDSKGKRSFIKYPKGGGKAKVLSIPEGVKIESTVKNDGGMKNVLTFKESGETKYLVLNGSLGEAVAGAVTGRTLARPPAWISWGTRAYAATSTALSPTFALRNLTADNFDIHNYLVSKHGFIKGEKMFAKVLAEQGKMIWPLMRYVYTGDFKFGKNGEMSKFQKLVEAYEDAGGLIGGMATEGYDATVKKVQAKFRAGKNKVRAVGEGVIKGWLTLQRMSELGPRLAVFKAGVDSGMSAKDAAMMAREATVDFNKKGQKTPWFNTLWMFSNSALGANLTQLKNINSRAGITLLGGWCLYGFAEGLVDAMLGGDDDELDEEGLATGEDISEYTRKNSLYIRKGSTVYRANIHMGPFAYAKYFGNCMARVAAGKLDSGKAAKELTKSGVEIGTTLTGLGNVNAEAFFQTAIPTLAQTFTQIGTGVDYAGREMYRKKYTEEHPDSSYGRPSTPQVYHNVAKWLNRVTGGNEARKGWIDVRPETLQALTEMVGKNFARDVVEISETGYKVATGDTENLDIRNVPFAGDFVRTHESNANRFYEAYNMYRADKYELKNNPELKGEARRKFLKEHPWLYSAGKPGVTRIDNIVKRIEKLRDIEESDRATEERKAEAKAMRLKLQARVIKIMEGK